jgi:hypothetical protein
MNVLNTKRRNSILILSTIFLVFLAELTLDPRIISTDFNNNIVIIKPEASDDPIMEEFFVSPTGDDLNTGEDTDHPFANISKAQESVRAICGAMTGDIIVYLRGGIYFINKSLEFIETDTATNNYQIIYKNYQNEVPIVSGGQMITGWSVYSGNIWRAKVNNVSDFRQMYVNGEKKIRARGDADFIVGTTGDGHVAIDDRMMYWINIQDVEFVYQNIWTLPRIQVEWVYKENIYMQQPSFLFSRTNSDSQKKAPAWIENAFELLDEPNEWYFNQVTGYLYYMPEEGEDLSTAEVIVPKVETIVNITGTMANRVSNITFQGISFQHGNWVRPSEYGINYAETQANVYKTIQNGVRTSNMSEANIQCRYALNITFQSCNFTRLGTTAIEFREGSQFSRIVGCLINDTAGIAIQIGEVSNASKYDPNDPFTVKDIYVFNNYITNCSTEYMSGPGIFTGYVRNIRIEHNTISNLPYTGISVGWGWSPLESVMANNSVKFNRIYGIMNFLHDGAGIYTLSTQPGLNVSYNVIHDSGNCGLYPDERTNGSVWSYNVAWDCDNEMQDHSMYETGEWNQIFNNYIADYPKILSCWYPERDSQQIWGLEPGDVGFPQDIFDMSGVEPNYQYLVPTNEIYWHYTDLVANNLLTIFPAVFLILIAGIGICGVFGCYTIISTKGTISRKEDETHV